MIKASRLILVEGEEGHGCVVAVMKTYSHIFDAMSSQKIINAFLPPNVEKSLPLFLFLFLFLCLFGVGHG